MFPMKRAYTNGILLDGTEQMQPEAHKILLTEDDKIIAIVDEGVDLDGYEVIDLHGGYLCLLYFFASISSIFFVNAANSSSLYKRVSITMRPSLSISTLRVMPALRSAYLAKISAPGSNPKG